MENNNAKEATEVWVLLRYSLGMSPGEGLWPLGVFDTLEKAQIALAQYYEAVVEDSDEDEVSELFYIKSTHLCDIVPKST